MIYEPIVAGLGCNICSEIADQIETAVGLSSQSIVFDKNTLAQMLMQACLDASDHCQTEGFDTLVSRYDQYHLFHEQTISYRYQNRTCHAVVHGVSPRGFLLVRDGDQDLILRVEQVSHVRLVQSDREFPVCLSSEAC